MMFEKKSVSSAIYRRVEQGSKRCTVVYAGTVTLVDRLYIQMPRLRYIPCIAGVLAFFLMN